MIFSTKKIKAMSMLNANENMRKGKAANMKVSMINSSNPNITSNQTRKRNII